MSDNSAIPENHQEDAVAPPPAPETPIPDGVVPPEPATPEESPDIPAAADIPIADAVIPPPPPEAMVPQTRSSRRTPAILEGDQPAAAADDWAQPSVAPQVPTSGGYRGLTVAIFVFLVALLVAAIVFLFYLVNNTTFDLPSFAGGATAIAAFAP
ncbi:MAG TPA: hypothetical protein VN241_13510 [Microbacterium sp.]|nr:hypothetical protein [Microbacterium sp.]